MNRLHGLKSPCIYEYYDVMTTSHLHLAVSNETVEAAETDKPFDLQVRTLCLVDIENMACGSELRNAKVARLQRQIEATAELREGDQVVVAAGPSKAQAAWQGWKGSARRLMGKGLDGADLALLETIEDLQWVADRFKRVVIASGDHIFAPAVAALKARGVEVTVIAPPVGLSKQMRLAAGRGLKSLMFSLADEIHSVYTQRQEPA